MAESIDKNQSKSPTKSKDDKTEAKRQPRAVTLLEIRTSAQSDRRDFVPPFKTQVYIHSILQFPMMNGLVGTVKFCLPKSTIGRCGILLDKPIPDIAPFNKDEYQKQEIAVSIQKLWPTIKQQAVHYRVTVENYRNFASRKDKKEFRSNIGSNDPLRESVRGVVTDVFKPFFPHRKYLYNEILCRVVMYNYYDYEKIGILNISDKSGEIQSVLKNELTFVQEEGEAEDVFDEDVQEILNGVVPVKVLAEKFHVVKPPVPPPSPPVEQVTPDTNTGKKRIKKASETVEDKKEAKEASSQKKRKRNTAGEEYVGRYIAQDFSGVMYFGKIRKMKDGGNLACIRFCDGDYAEYDLEELSLYEIPVDAEFVFSKGPPKPKSSYEEGSKEWSISEDMAREIDLQVERWSPNDHKAHN